MLSVQRHFRIEDFTPLCRDTDQESFRQATAEAFLLHRGMKRPMVAPERQWQPTRSAQRLSSVLALSRGALVFPVIGKGSARRRNPADWFATVGRAEENEVVLPDLSVSMFHAVFHRGARWQYLVSDAGSRNGTFVNGQRAPDSEEGPGREIAPGMELRFGTMRLTFVLAAQLYRMARSLAEGLNRGLPPRGRGPQSI
jgi:pSer/pThr/pTyr-binding forkhead associated (FHA) protein